jgi:hypothetical protein
MGLILLIKGGKLTSFELNLASAIHLHPKQPKGS